MSTAVCSLCYANLHATRHHILLPASWQRWHSRLYPSQSRYSILLPRRDAKLSWPSGLVIYRDGTIPTRRWSSSPVLTELEVQQLHWYVQRRRVPTPRRQPCEVPSLPNSSPSLLPFSVSSQSPFPSHPSCKTAPWTIAGSLESAVSSPVGSRRSPSQPCFLCRQSYKNFLFSPFSQNLHGS